MTTADQVRAAVSAVTDPELRRPIGDMDMVRTVSVDRPRRFATASVCIPSASIWRISRWRAVSVRSPSSSTIVDDSAGST